MNGRTDLFMHAQDASAVLDEAIGRLRALVEAGADSVYPWASRTTTSCSPP